MDRDFFNVGDRVFYNSEEQDKIVESTITYISVGRSMVDWEVDFIFENNENDSCCFHAKKEAELDRLETMLDIECGNYIELIGKEGVYTWQTNGKEMPCVLEDATHHIDRENMKGCVSLTIRDGDVYMDILPEYFKYVS